MSGKDSLQTALAVTSCRLSRLILRGLNRGGTSLPGKLAMWFRRDILAITSEGVKTILVTGTNGKTTTAAMLSHAMQEAGRAPLSNSSGANLLSGVTAEFAAAADLRGRPLRGRKYRGSQVGHRIASGGRPMLDRKDPDHPVAEADRGSGLYAVIECDEGALRQVAPLLKPRVIVVTNLFRDQLDRYGEVMHTLEAIREGIRLAPEAVLCLNADDSLVTSLAIDVPNPVIWFGIEETAVQDRRDAGKTDYAGEADSPDRISDARYCIRCGAEYTFRYHTYAHLGDFRCPCCGYARPVPDVAVTSIDGIDTGGSRVHMRVPGRESVHREIVPPEKGYCTRPFEGRDSNLRSPMLNSLREWGERRSTRGFRGKPAKNASNFEGVCTVTERASEESVYQELPVRIALPAVYNIYNAAAALAAYAAAKLPMQEILKGLERMQSSFGRMEHFEIRGVSIQMILVKNPAGCNQALDYLCTLKEPCTIVLCLNDLDADGHDISWIWDVDYEKLYSCSNIRRILVWGKRAEDLQLRLKYAGFQEKRIRRVPEKELKKLLDAIYKSEVPVFILPNYTTMLPLRDALRRAAGKESFWKG